MFSLWSDFQVTLSVSQSVGSGAVCVSIHSQAVLGCKLKHFEVLISAKWPNPLTSLADNLSLAKLCSFNHSIPKPGKVLLAFFTKRGHPKFKSEIHIIVYRLSGCRRRTVVSWRQIQTRMKRPKNRRDKRQKMERWKQRQLHQNPIKPVTKPVSDLIQCISDLESLLRVFKLRWFRTVCS